VLSDNCKERNEKRETGRYETEKEVQWFPNRMAEGWKTNQNVLNN
jgi:ribosome biogenesis GTPase A